MLEIFLMATLGVLVVIGLRHPAIAFGAYLWADLVRPQDIGFGISGEIPYSNILAALTLMSALINRKRLSKPTSWYVLLAIIVFLFWTLQTYTYSVNPIAAAFKVKWVIKSLGFCIITLIIINSKETIEFFLLMFTACTTYFSFSAGIKTLAGGGGYGLALVHASSNNGLAESSTLAGVSVACLPFLFFFFKNSTLFEGNMYFRIFCVGAMIIFVFGVIGTVARTGLVCLGVLFICIFMISRRKILLASLAVIFMVGLFAVAGDDWRTRMSTILTNNTNTHVDDAKVIGRVEVWRWVIDYSKQNPLGGGMDSYLENDGQLAFYTDAPNVAPQTKARAFHNVYLELLGEQGYPGLLLYMSIILLTIWRLLRMRKPHAWQGCDPDTVAWATSLATACVISLLILMTMGMFVGVAYRLYLFIPVIAAAGLSYMNKQYLAAYYQANIEKVRESMARY